MVDPSAGRGGRRKSLPGEEAGCEATAHWGGRRAAGGTGCFLLSRSVLLGLLVAVAYAVGVNLLGIDVGAGIGEAFVFTIAALGAIVGIRLPTAKVSGPLPR